MKTVAARLSLLFCLLAPSGQAVELRIHYAAIQKVLAREVFTEDGRRYVKGNPAAKCSFAYLEQPELRAENGRLALKAHFTGRSGLDVFGRCIGLGDSFDVYLTAVPVYQGKTIGLKDVHAESRAPGGAVRTSYYMRRVCAALSDTLRKQFQYRLADDVARLVGQSRPDAPYKVDLLDFHVAQIQVTADALVLTVDFKVAVE